MRSCFRHRQHALLDSHLLAAEMESADLCIVYIIDRADLIICLGL